MRDFQTPGRSAVFATEGMCATSHPLAAKVALDILGEGGNAVDAAIGGAALLGLCEPQMTGIGGDLFALVSRPGEPVVAVNGSGRAPMAHSAADLRARGHDTVALDSAQAVTIPGAIDGFCTLSERYGTLGLARTLAPTIRYMDAGVPVAPRTAFDWARDAGRLRGAARDHFLPDGAAPTAGTLFRLPAQAEVLRRVARDGRDAFYTGEIAEDMLAALTEAGGGHTAQDFAATATTFDTQISGLYRDRELIEHRPNGQGATAILLLNILGHFDLAERDPTGADRIHIEAEAAKLAYDARNRFLGDADHVSRLERMLAPETARALAALIDPTRAMPSAAAVSEAVHKDTVYLTVVDRDRMAVSLIYSIFHGFGSGIASRKFGILLQNRGAGFTLEAGHPNELNPGKRPMHTIIPALLRQGETLMPFGVMGGQYQPAGHARLVTNLADYGMDLQGALDAPRSFPENGVLKCERGHAPQTLQALADLGHEVVVPEVPLGGAQAIVMHPSGVLEGASDPRKDGCALGY